MFKYQIPLPGFEPIPELDFLFFALLPDAEDVGQIAQLRDRLLLERGLTGQPIAAERLHVSLHAVGAWHGLSRAAVSAAKGRRSLVFETSV
jgi:2'-5' RNA ligase